MAWLFTRPKSPYHWCGYRDPITGKTIRESTKIQLGGLANLRKARAHCAKRSFEENSNATRYSTGLFESWVSKFLHQRYSASPKTKARIEGSWTAIQKFFDAQDIEHPAQVTRQHCLDYLDWRKGLGHGNSKRKGKPIAHNTAVLEVKFIGIILQEAVVRGYMTANPALKLGIKREPARVKDEMTEWHYAVIKDRIEEIRKTPATKQLGDFLHASFTIARLQGCRLKETGFHARQVDWENLTVETVVKGGKIHTFALHPELVPFLKDLFTRQPHTWNVGPKFNASLAWFKFFDHLRSVHPGEFARVSFHSTRVTWTSRMERAGVPESVVMGQLGHASTTVHRIYRRVKSSELQPYWSAVSGSGSKQSADSPQSPGCPSTTVAPPQPTPAA